MSKTRILIGVLALGSGLVAAYMGMKVIKKPPEKEVVEISTVDTVDVLVASKQITMGDKLANGAIAWQTWPQSVIAPNMITKAEDPEALTKFEQARARVEIYEGEPILEKKLVMPNDNGFMAAILPKGYRAISVRITEETGAGGFILPNDRVDVLMTRKIDDDSNSTGKTVYTETVVTNVRVLAINQIYKPSPDGEQAIPQGKTATLELDPHQSEVVAMAETAGQLSLALRSIAETDNALGDAPVLSEKYARGQGESSFTTVKYGVVKKITNLQ